MWKSFNNIISGINESVRGKTSCWILIYLRITMISTLYQTKLSIKFLVRLQHNAKQKRAETLKLNKTLKNYIADTYIEESVGTFAQTFTGSTIS